MEYFLILVQVAEIALYSYLLFFGLYNLFFSILAFFYRQRAKQNGEFAYQRFVIFIPAYKEDGVICETAQVALSQNYPSEMYKVVVIADSLRGETLQKLWDMRIVVHEVWFENSTKAKAVNSALQSVKDDYDYAVILDADNHMEPSYLDKLNAYLQHPQKVVQTHRTAKNTNTSLAILDGISEEVNNRIFRQGHVVAELSSALIGSGMVFDFELFKTIIPQVTAVGGFDKELELRLLRDRIHIAYTKNIYVYDEKVQNADTFKHQRRRWLSAQLVYLGRYFFDGLWRLIFHGNIDYFDKVLQMAAPPRILMLPVVLSIAVLIACLQFLDIYTPFFSTMLWTVSTSVAFSAVALAIPSRLYRLINFKILLQIPLSVLHMFSALIKTKGANKTFIHTHHGTEI